MHDTAFFFAGGTVQTEKKPGTILNLPQPAKT